MRGDTGIEQRIELEYPGRYQLTSHSSFDDGGKHVEGFWRSHDRFAECRFKGSRNIEDFEAAIWRVVPKMRCIADRPEEQGTMLWAVNAMKANACINAA